MRTWNAHFASVGRRFTKTLAMLATLLLLTAGSAMAQPAEEGGEAVSYTHLPRNYKLQITNYKFVHAISRPTAGAIMRSWSINWAN